MNPLRALELRIPPAAVVLLCGVAIWLIGKEFPRAGFTLRGAHLLAAALGIAGVTVVFLGVRAFRRVKTTVNPLSPAAATTLVATGIYRRTRNPMYLGMLLLLAGWAVVVGNLVAGLVLPVFVLYMNRFQIAPEERSLAARFGTSYTRYCAAVRRWL